MLKGSRCRTRFESLVGLFLPLWRKPELDKQLYEDFLTDPDSVDANWRSRSSSYLVRESNRINSTLKRVIFPPPGERRFTLLFNDLRPYTNVKQVKVLQLINAYRFRGTSMRISIRWDCGSKIKWPI